MCQIIARSLESFGQDTKGLRELATEERTGKLYQNRGTRDVLRRIAKRVDEKEKTIAIRTNRR